MLGRSDEKSSHHDEERARSRTPPSAHSRQDSKSQKGLLHSHSNPADMASGNVRYARYVLFALFGIIVIYLISSSSLPQYTEPIKNAAGQYTASLTTSNDDSSKPAAVDDPAVPIKAVPTHATLKSTNPTSPAFNDDFDLSPAAPGARANATFVTLARNSDIWEIARSIRQVEDRFNRNYHYDWVFLNDKPFDDSFKKITTALVSGKTHYGEIAEEHWSFPSWIDQDKARKVREDMAQRKIIYGDSISYRHMCRFESGFFFRQPLMMNYEYYWRVEPSVELFCDVHYDPFKMMADQKKKYSFVISLYEYVDTIPTLWDSAKKFMKKHPEHINKNNALKFLSDDDGDTYNKCHFWSNFEIGSLEWLRSKAYTDFFDVLDKDGGFFYERWGDAPVHSIAAGLLLDKSEIHFFNDIAYYHVPFTHCPTGEDLRVKLRCHCDPAQNFDWKGYSCTNRFFDVAGLEKPKGWEGEQ